MSLIGSQTRGLINTRHLIDFLGDDLDIIHFSADRVFEAARGGQIVLLHEPQDSPWVSAGSLETKSGPHLSAAFSMERGISKHRTDMPDTLAIGARTYRSSSGAVGPGATPALKVDGRACQLPNPTNSGQTVWFSCGGRDGRTHLLDLLPGKRRLPSRLRIFSRTSSDSMVTSPSFSRSRLISSLSGSSRFFMAISPAERKSSHKRDICGAVAAYSRQRSCKSSPRRRRSAIRDCILAKKRLGLWCLPAGPSTALVKGACDRPLAFPFSSPMSGHLLNLSYSIIGIQSNCVSNHFSGISVAFFIEATLSSR